MALVALVLTNQGTAEPAGKSKDTLDCSKCHACEHPSKTNPCLIPGQCPRHAAMAGLDANTGPRVVVLDELENLYESVRFDHLAHAQMVRFSGGCETCHHFTPPNAEHPACKDCHPADVAHEDLAQPGLKGAYHRNCMNCHREWDHDTACEICHAKKGNGAVAAVPGTEHGRYQPIVLDELILFTTDHDGGDVVPFHHRNHSVLYERDCTECHHEQGCSRCHIQDKAPHPMGEPASRDLHETCFQCHKEEKCGDCHGRDPDDLFKHASTGWPLEKYHSKLGCRACHGRRGPFMQLSPQCDTCHPRGWDAGTFQHAVTGVALDEVHVEADCSDCHTEGPASPPDCSGCHDDGRRYDSQVGFTG